MKDHSGSGSKASPIFISDDENEMADVSGLLLNDNDEDSSSSMTPLVSHSARGNASKSSLQPLERRDPSSKTLQEVSKKRKRKREHSSALQNTAGPSKLPPAPAATKNKRMKHRHRDDAPVFDESTFEPDPRATTRSFSPYSIDATPVDSSFSSSEWVNSMAKAADPPDILQNLFPIPWDFLVPPPTWPSQPMLSDFDPPSSFWPAQPTAPSVPPEMFVRKAVSSGVPKKLPSNNIIGMPSARDPEGKRRDFKLSSTTVFESNPKITYPHSPNPSCSLILDQLPKLCRTPQWLKSWSRDVCGAPPVFVAIDSSSAKALLEFATAGLAEQAWNSPKLGKGISLLSSAQLKGMSREDLIRAWWYHPISPELVFSRKELEEGEIEDDAAMVDGRKESKKERKTRLTRLEREKQKKEGAESNAKYGNDQVFPLATTSSALLSPEPLTVPQNHVQITSPSPPPRSLAWPLPTAYVSSTLASHPVPASLRLHSDSSSQASVLPTVRHIWHRPSSENAFTGPLANRRSSPPSISTMNPDRFTEDDIDMELASPDALSTPMVPEVASTGTTLNVPSPVSFVSGEEEDTAQVLSSQPPVVSGSLPTPTPTPPIPGLERTNTPPSDSLPPLSEPAITKATPMGPSFVKRSLLARQKELEKRIARSKMELEQSGVLVGKQSDTVQSAGQQTPSVSQSSTSSTFKSTTDSIPDKQAMEDNLRRLVLASQRKKLKHGVPVPAETGRAHSEKAVKADHAHPDSSNGTRTAADSLLDDLAVSFIQESIQTIQPTLPLSISAAPAAQPQLSSSSAGLAARREHLEFQIAETKKLMDLLSQTISKQERDSIMTRIRELSRVQEHDALSPATTPNLSHTSYPSFLVKPIEHVKSLWPESIPNGGILIVSDDEDEDEDDNEDDD